MGNGGTRQKPKKAGQAQSALPNGNQPQQLAAGGMAMGGAGGASDAENQELELVFEVCKLSPVTYLDASEGKAIEVQKRNNDFVVLLNSKHLGNVPPDYEDRLSRSQYRGTVYRVNRKPQAVSVRVSL